MRIYRRGKYYWAQWRGERFSLHTTDKIAAELAFREHQRSAADPTYATAHETTIEQALADYVAHVRAGVDKKRSPHTVKMIELHAGHIVRLLGAKRTLASIGSTEVDGYIIDRDREGAARTTIGKERSTLRGCLKLAARHKRFHTPLEQVFAPFDLEYEPLDRHLTEPELTRLLAELPENRAAVVAFIVATAADWSPAMAAKREHFTASTIKVAGSKRSRRMREVPILTPFKKLAARARAWLDVHGSFEPWGSVRRDVELACVRAKVPRISPRDLRRTHSKILRAHGISPQLIAPMLGHADGRMVERVYGKTTADVLGPLIEAELNRYTSGTRRNKKTGKRRQKADSSVD